MKKVLSAVLVLSFLVSGAVFAEETKKEEMSGMSMDKPAGMPMPGMGKMGCSMMGKAQMVSTDEGGVIVLAGNKLMKYDADLNLVKEAEVVMPPMGGKQCPMMGKMMDQGSSPAAPVEVQEKKA